MKKLLLSYLFLPLIMIGFATSAMAFGVGGYFSFDGGKTKWTSDAINDETSTNIIYGGGFVMDTAVAMDRLFNYRLNFGYQRYNAKFNSTGTGGRLSLRNTFGFGVVRSKVVRFWLGPQISINYIYGERSSSIFEYNGSVFLFRNYKHDVDLGGINLGPALGLNFNIGNVFTIFLEGGINFTVAGGSNWVTRSGLYGLTFIPPEEYKEGLLMYGFEGYASIGILFRVGGDSYK